MKTFFETTAILEDEDKTSPPAPHPSWPKGFFEDIRIDDPAFVRPDQGDMPPIVTLSL